MNKTADEIKRRLDNLGRSSRGKPKPRKYAATRRQMIVDCPHCRGALFINYLEFSGGEIEVPEIREVRICELCSKSYKIAVKWSLVGVPFES